MTVGQRFDAFLSMLKLTPDQRADGITKHSGVRECLNKHYYGLTSGTANSMLVGSWGKDTEVRPPRDIDILFELPKEVYYRYEQRPGNKQSQLLQEVKGILAAKYSNTKMRGDGQVVVVPFTSFAVEVVPAFLQPDDKYWVCDTNGGGRYKTFDPKAEIANVSESSNSSNGNTRDLIRMMKCWQEYCSVPLKSFCIELIAIDFLASWAYRGKSTIYYDWMTRDFLDFLIKKAGGMVVAPGTWEVIWLGDEWKSRAETAYQRAIKACEYESQNNGDAAGEEWQKIFGPDIPRG